MILCFSVKVFYFLQENFNVWIEEKHKIIDVSFLSFSLSPLVHPFLKVEFQSFAGYDLCVAVNSWF